MKKSAKDPFAHLEAKRYQNPVPSREYILQTLQEIGHPESFNYLTKRFKVKTEQHEAFERRLNAMVRDGQIMKNRRQKFGLVTKMNLRRGSVFVDPDGNGFVNLDKSNERIFLDPKQMRLVFPGDKVLVRMTDAMAMGCHSGIIVEILDRGDTILVGTLFEQAGAMFISPDNKGINKDILIPPSELNHAKAGQVVEVKCLIPAVPNFRRTMIGRVVKILGDHLDPGLEIDIAIRAHGIPHEWPNAVVKEAQKFPKRVPAQDKEGRKDLRHLPFVTIDGIDAKDFDDAVFAESVGKNGWKLFVAIADVSHYIKPDSALDAEAERRGTSVYFPEHVIPMLPEALSNGLCSLKPKVDRLAMVAEMRVDKDGKLLRSRFYPAVIKSHARLTYTHVTEVLQGEDVREKYLPQLIELHELALVLIKLRTKRGAIEFDFPEPYIVFDEDKKIEKLVIRERNIAHRIIEECMLLANVTAANFVAQNEIPCLYRTHGSPKEDKLKDLKKYLKELGFKLGGGKDPQPHHFSVLMNQIKHREDAKILEKMLLRTMQQAVYSSDDIGHFALAYQSYTHFTSPIRRYPDLIVHRAINTILARRKKLYPYQENQMKLLGEHCSKTERRADMACWDVIAWLKCEFMRDKVGQEFVGHINTAVAFGIFVELRDYFIEGLVHVTALKNDYYHFDSIRHQLKGERTGVVYKIGDEVKVRLVRVNLEEKQIDFELVGDEDTEENIPKKNRKRRKKRR